MEIDAELVNKLGIVGTIRRIGPRVPIWEKVWRIRLVRNGATVDVVLSRKLSEPRPTVVEGVKKLAQTAWAVAHGYEEFCRRKNTLPEFNLARLYFLQCCDDAQFLRELAGSDEFFAEIVFG